MWKYFEISSLNLDVAIRLGIEPEKHLTKQAPMHMHPDLAAKVEAEKDNLVKFGFINEV